MVAASALNTCLRIHSLPKDVKGNITPFIFSSNTPNVSLHVRLPTGRSHILYRAPLSPCSNLFPAISSSFWILSIAKATKWSESAIWMWSLSGAASFPSAYSHDNPQSYFYMLLPAVFAGFVWTFHSHDKDFSNFIHRDLEIIFLFEKRFPAPSQFFPWSSSLY